MPLYEFEVTLSAGYFVAAPNEALAKAYVHSKGLFSWSGLEPEFDDVYFVGETEDDIDMAHEWVDEKAQAIRYEEYLKLQELIEEEERNAPEPWPIHWPKPLPLPFDGVPLMLPEAQLPESPPELLPLDIKWSPGLKWEDYKERYGIE